MGRRSICIVVVAAALGPAPAQALAGHAKPLAGHAQHHRGTKGAKPKLDKADLATTKTYIEADYALVHTARVNLLTGEAALEKVRETLTTECPAAAAASPENEAAEHLSNEVIGTMGVAFIRSDVPAVTSFDATVSPLRWTNPKLTRKATIYASKLKALTALQAPNVCADVHAWAASGYRALPASTTQFDKLYSAEDVGIGEVPAQLLAPYEDSHERTVLALTTQFENELVDAEARAVEPWSKILDALMLNP